MVWFGEQLAEARRPGWPRGSEIAATDRHGRREGALRGGLLHDERAQCEDGIDNDLDGLVDLGSDGGCLSYTG